jgi:hypothetical protein
MVPQLTGFLGPTSTTDTFSNSRGGSNSGSLWAHRSRECCLADNMAALTAGASSWHAPTFRCMYRFKVAYSAGYWRQRGGWCYRRKAADESTYHNK